jgi:hypothetical protein
LLFLTLIALGFALFILIVFEATLTVFKPVLASLTLDIEC